MNKTMTQKIIALANHKGGVGKTTATASIGSALAQMGYNTLLVDLDAQANLTTSLLPDGSETERTIYHSIKERKQLPTIKVKENLFITPSSLDMAGIELELSSALSREYILKNLLQSEAQAYDYVILDCPPSLALISVNAFVAATDTVVPLTAEALPFKGLKMLEEVLEMVRSYLNPALKLSGVFLSKWEGRNINKMIEEALCQKYGDKLLTTKIRTDVKITEATLATEDIFTYYPKSRGAADYQALTEELLQKLK